MKYINYGLMKNRFALLIGLATELSLSSGPPETDHRRERYRRINITRPESGSYPRPRYKSPGRAIGSDRIIADGVSFRPASEIPKATSDGLSDDFNSAADILALKLTYFSEVRRRLAGLTRTCRSGRAGWYRLRTPRNHRLQKNASLSLRFSR